uniref:Uncharacterized protein n=1 Tax=Glossina austeni TaxID=7395 RepID=A0A1A9UI72_GLOAU
MLPINMKDVYKIVKSFKKRKPNTSTVAALCCSVIVFLIKFLSEEREGSNVTDLLLLFSFLENEVNDRAEELLQKPFIPCVKTQWKKESGKYLWKNIPFSMYNALDLSKIELSMLLPLQSHSWKV